MVQPNSMFSQLLSVIPRDEFKKSVHGLRIVPGSDLYFLSLKLFL